MRDLIVVGSGPAGATCARKAALRGLDVLLLEKSRHPREKLCGGALNPRVPKALGFDIRPVLDREVHSARIHAPSGRNFLVTNHGLSSYMIRRNRFDSYLVQKAEEAGAQVIQDSEVVALQQTRSAVRALCRGDSYESHLLVGADGAEGIVARESGIRSSWPPNRMALCMAADVSMDEADIRKLTAVDGESDELAMEFYLGTVDWGYGWCFPKAESVCIGIGCRMDRMRNLQVAWMRFLKRINEEKGLSIRPAVEDTFKVPVGYPEWSLVGRRIMLTGDAAGLASPLTGEGIYYAIVSGSIAADVSVQAIESKNAQEVLAFSQRMRKELIPELESAEFIARRLMKSTRSLEIACEVAQKDRIIRDLIIQFVAGSRSAQKSRNSMLKRMLIHHPLESALMGLG
ncbi:MAG: hypothetical protein C4K47_07750 [Candidatus Thorarchaeota archaeon]|nr:MAG: hypothetical protein C4K47_07750 [Candidatus Thorarchaeota archaeon]